MGLYSKYVLPKLINCACGTAQIEKQRSKLVPLATGRVLEVGSGSGLNFPHYSADKVSSVSALEPSEELITMCDQQVLLTDAEIDLVQASALEIPFDSASFDTVVVTYTLCTIDQHKEALAEILRVLRSDGRLLFCEHGLAPEKKVANWQRRLEPIWSRVAGGCRLTKDIPSIIEQAGFEIADMDQMYLPGAPKIAAYNFWGSAIRSG